MKFLTGSETFPAFGIPTKIAISFNHGFQKVVFLQFLPAYLV